MMKGLVFVLFMPLLAAGVVILMLWEAGTNIRERYERAKAKATMMCEEGRSYRLLRDYALVETDKGVFLLQGKRLYPLERCWEVATVEK